MQFNRKYDLMLAILFLLAVMIFQGDSELFHNLKRNQVYHSKPLDREVIFIESSKTLENNASEEVFLNEDIFITESKNWIINKESILGY